MVECTILAQSKFQVFFSLLLFKGSCPQKLLFVSVKISEYQGFKWHPKLAESGYNVQPLAFVVYY